jgi:hypothetical protein
MDDPGDSPDDGQVVLSIGGSNSGTIDYFDNSATIAAKIAQITGVTSVSVTGTFDSAGNTVTVTFTGDPGVNFDQFVVVTNTLYNSSEDYTYTLTPATVTNGGSGGIFTGDLATDPSFAVSGESEIKLINDKNFYVHNGNSGSEDSQVLFSVKGDGRELDFQMTNDVASSDIILRSTGTSGPSGAAELSLSSAINGEIALNSNSISMSSSSMSISLFNDLDLECDAIVFDRQSGAGQITIEPPLTGVWRFRFPEDEGNFGEYLRAVSSGVAEWSPLTAPRFSDGTRPAPTAVGQVIFNVDDNTLNVADGANWRDMTGAIT